MNRGLLCAAFLAVLAPASLRARDEKVDTLVVTTLLAEIPGKFEMLLRRRSQYIGPGNA